MSICIGQTKAGKSCGKTAQSGRKYCKIHDQDYKDAKKASIAERKTKSTKTLEHIAARVNSKRLIEGEQEDKLVKSVKNHSDETISGYLQKEIIPCIKRLAVMEYDLYGYPREETPFPRKIWMMVSWYLSDDTTAYMNVAMACKGFYKVFVQDKVRYYVHPLKNELKNPSLFFRPIFRVLSLEVPDDLDDILETMDLPRVADLMALYDEELGPTKTPGGLIRRKAKAISELMKYLVTVAIEPDQEVEESIKGAGLYEDYTQKAKFHLEDFPYRYRLFKRGTATYVMIDAQGGPQFERKLKDSLLPYDGKYLIKLMYVN